MDAARDGAPVGVTEALVVIRIRALRAGDLQQHQLAVFPFERGSRDSGRVYIDERTVGLHVQQPAALAEPLGGVDDAARSPSGSLTEPTTAHVSRFRS